MFRIAFIVFMFSWDYIGINKAFHIQKHPQKVLVYLFVFLYENFILYALTLLIEISRLDFLMVPRDGCIPLCP